MHAPPAAEPPVLVLLLVHLGVGLAVHSGGLYFRGDRP